MEKTVKFLNEAGVFFVSTINGNKPEVRPFGALNVFKTSLVSKNPPPISTTSGKSKCSLASLNRHTSLPIILSFLAFNVCNISLSFIKLFPIFSTSGKYNSSILLLQARTPFPIIFTFLAFNIFKTILVCKLFVYSAN